MGLSENKSRRKIDKDPNNTKWARNTSSFGHKILRSQGWEPGQYLGAKDAAQAAHYTAANASFVRATLKDDMLGLGFKTAKEEQVTGMGAFQDMLSRLNGKSDDSMSKEREARTAVQTTLYCDSKFGPMRFVSGGWLVGDKQQKDSPVAKLKEQGEGKTTKKRKADEVSLSNSDSDLSSKDEKKDEKARKKRRKEERKAAKKTKKINAATSGSTTPTDKTNSTTVFTSGEEEKKTRKAKAKLATELSDSTQSEAESTRKKKKSKKGQVNDVCVSDVKADDSKDSGKSANKKKKKKSKKDAEGTPENREKAVRKEEKRLKKDKNKRAAEEATNGSNTQTSTSTPLDTGTSTPTATGSGTSTPVLRGHHAVRSKWIASKRMATMDDAALNQIFMIKAPST